MPGTGPEHLAIVTSSEVARVHPKVEEEPSVPAMRVCTGSEVSLELVSVKCWKMSMSGRDKFKAAKKLSSHGAH